MIFDGVASKIVRTDICIVGSGIGGGTIAKYLSESNCEISIIEAGGLEKGTSKVSYESVGRDFGLRTTTAIQVGGTSNLWHGVLAPLDPIDFKPRHWIAHSGWPISFEELQPFYHCAAGFLNVEKPNYFSLDKLSNQMKAKLSDVDFSKDHMKHKVFQQPLPPLNFKDVVVDVCKMSESHHLYYNSAALELVSKGNKIESLKIGNLDGSISVIDADIFIIASGALETPRLLLNSNIDNDNIGRFLMDHPMGNLCQMELKTPRKAPIYTDLKYSKNMKLKVGFELLDHIQEELSFPNHCFYLRPSFIKGINNNSEKIKMALLSFRDGKVSGSDILNLIRNPNAIRQILTYKFSLDVTLKYADLFFVTEQTPNPDSRVSLSQTTDFWGYKRSMVDWRVSEGDIQSMKLFFELLLDDLFDSSNCSFTHSIKDFDWENTYTSAVHHVGTARMGLNRNYSVVDKNLKSFDRENLYICDGSVFSTAGNVNSGLTISALAIRLASHLLST
ncbi:GMC oxidoreductase [Oceanospirillaceae bacterium]|nr:GMC oxidoreductase [Oceanospirillaceae bacterium]